MTTRTKRATKRNVRPFFVMEFREFRDEWAFEESFYTLESANEYLGDMLRLDPGRELIVIETAVRSMGLAEVSVVPARARGEDDDKELS